LDPVTARADASQGETASAPSTELAGCTVADAGRKSQAKKSEGYLPSLDGWRAVAILGVILAHGTDTLFEPGSLAHRLTRHGALGVDIFFGISGFLITTRLLEEHRRQGKVSLSGFYVRRVFRIVPPYLAFLGVIGASALTGFLHVGSWEYLSCLLFYRNYLAPQELGGWYTGHFWSLAVEEHFYLLWPALLVACGVFRARLVVPMLALGLAAWRVWDFRHQWLETLLPGVGFYVRTDIRLDALLWACLLALLLEAPGWKERLTRWLSLPVWLVLLGAFIVCVVFQPPLALLCQSLLIPVILAGTVLRPTMLVSRGLEAGLLRWLGRLSYSLYIWQQLFLVGREESRPLPLRLVQEWPGNLLALVACAAASYYLIERPMVRRGHRLAAPARTEQVKV
jgi:peptidoglycan/LPS O-acetylase OafA/YrhL